MKYVQCVTCPDRAVWLSFWGNSALVILKISAGIIGGSNALVADGIHSSIDVIVAIVTIAALVISKKGPDNEHPYGHGKVESIAATMVTAGLSVAVIFLFKGAIADLRSGVIARPNFITFIVAVISIITNEIMFYINLCAGKEHKSPALTANAWHNRYDSLTSVIVAIGILLAIAGFESFDPIAAVLVGIVIIKISIDIFMDAYHALMDHSIQSEEKSDIQRIVEKEKDVLAVKKIEGRRIGQKLWIDLIIKLPPTLSVSRSSEISENIREAILFNVGNIEDVQIEIVTI